ncbi:head-tail connector protein [uncultured Roseibium sp.]|uniref:head-tail connector protein n=1 Tax=uncultured Roseibium sp. TaxID=1936171 RepID=UPI00263954C7|nr:head-tail connector protein [uncultured Roseibium sp.]
MLKPKRITAPAEAPVSVAEAKAHLRVDSSDEDVLILSLLNAAVEKFDGRTGLLGRCLVTQTWSVKQSSFQGHRAIRLPFPDVDAASVVLKYFDVDNVEQTYASANYSVHEDEVGGFVLRNSDVIWPTVYDRPDAVSVEFAAGFGAADDVPSGIKAAILLTVGHLYEHREDVTMSGKGGMLPAGAQSLIAPYQMMRI